VAVEVLLFQGEHQDLVELVAAVLEVRDKVVQDQ
jgi:hypothetical protein